MNVYLLLHDWLGLLTKKRKKKRKEGSQEMGRMIISRTVVHIVIMKNIFDNI